MQDKNEFNSFSLISYIWQWRKLFLMICGATAVLSFFFSTSWFIKPQYKATTIIYAPRTNSISKILNSESNANERLDIKAYAVEEETEQMMQILNSREIKDLLIEKYDLANYYGISQKSKGWKTKLYEMLGGFIDIKRTKYGAIAITVTDWNPAQAAQIANDIADELDHFKNKIEFERAFIAYKALEVQIVEAENQMQCIEDTLIKLAQRGIYNYEAQAERTMQQYAIALAQGNIAGTQRLRSELVKLEKWGSISTSFRREQLYISDHIAQTKLKMLNAKMDMDTPMPVKFVLEKAVAPDKKSYPKKSIIALVSTVGVFFFMLMLLLFVDKIKKEITIET
jgi:capsular polysaccharide biosynthesis protein